MSWVEEVENGSRLMVSVQDREQWRTPVEIARGDDWFVNWADFPAVAITDDLWVAHWLARSGESTYAYAVTLATSTDEGRTWSQPMIAHADRSPTEHGFVSYFPQADGIIGAAWLDGHRTEDGGFMTLHAANVGTGVVDDETELDDSVCDCCQTDAAMTAAGPVVVYRDRTAEEIRDIGIVRQVDGAWQPPQRVAEDHWQIAACPVNGPAVTASGNDVAVAWFTMADGQPRVRLARSTDAGATFGDPLDIDATGPLGRVDAHLLPDGRVAVSYLDGGDETGMVRVAVVNADGRIETLDVGPTAPARSSGFPRMAAVGDQLWIAWREVNDAGERLHLGWLQPGP